MQTTLVDRLVAAAEVAIRSQAASLEHEPQRVRGLVVDLTIGAGQRVDDATVYLERRMRLGARASK